MLELGVVALERQDHAVLEELGDGDSAADVGDVRLLHIRAGGVDDDRLATLELVVQDARQARVAALRHPRGVEGGGALFGIVVDLEVLGLDDFEVEGAVLDLVLPELRREGTSAQRRERPNRCQRSADTSHAPYPFAPAAPVAPESPTATTRASPHNLSSWSK